MKDLCTQRKTLESRSIRGGLLELNFLRCNRSDGRGASRIDCTEPRPFVCGDNTRDNAALGIDRIQANDQSTSVTVRQLRSGLYIRSEAGVISIFEYDRSKLARSERQRGGDGDGVSSQRITRSRRLEGRVQGATGVSERLGYSGERVENPFTGTWCRTDIRDAKCVHRSWNRCHDGSSSIRESNSNRNNQTGCGSSVCIESQSTQGTSIRSVAGVENFTGHSPSPLRKNNLHRNWGGHYTLPQTTCGRYPNIL